MTIRRFLSSLARTLLGAVLILGGATLLYFAGWVAADEIVPQVASSGWSLSGSSTILNRNWQGNQLYLLVLLYLAVGSALVLGGLATRCRAGVKRATREGFTRDG